MKTFASYIFVFLFITFFGLRSSSQDIIIDDVNLSGTLGPGSFITFHDLFILEGDSLNIVAGTTIKFDQGKSLTVYGCLLSIGNTSSQVVYKSTGESVTWEGIHFPGNKSGSSRTDQVWNSKFLYSQFENVAGAGAILFTTDNPFIGIESINHCTFSDLENAVTFLFSVQGNILIMNSTFSGIQNTAITIGNTETVGIQVHDNNLDNLSNRFIYIYSNGLLSDLIINSNHADNLVLDKSLIRLDNNGNLASVQMKHNDFSNFTTSDLYPADEGIIYFKDLDNLDSFQAEDNRIDAILYEQDLSPSVKSFFHILYGKNISIDYDTVTRVNNLQHYLLLDNCESITINHSKYQDIACDVALFKLNPDNYCRTSNSWFENVITNSGNGCFYFNGIVSMDDIMLSNNHFRVITADNGPCLYIDAIEGAIDSIVFSGNIIEQNRLGYLTKQGGVANIRMNSIGKFKTHSNNISNCKVTNWGGVYYFDVSSVNTIDVLNDNLNYIESTNNGGYIAVKNTIFNENLLVDGLTVDSCFSNIGSGGLIYLRSENESTGEIVINNCTLNYIHAGSAESQNNGGAFYIKGNYLDLVFSNNQYATQQSNDLFPVAKNGGILYFEHGGLRLNSVSIENNEFDRANPLEVSGSGAFIYLTSTGITGLLGIVGNTTGNFKSSGNGGAYYFNLEGGCELFDIMNNSISECIADTSGGAIYFQSSSLGHLNIISNESEDQTFSDCRAVHGSGGTAFIQTEAAIGGANVEYNTVQSSLEASNAANDGGFLYVKCGGEQSGEIILSHNTVGDNNEGLTTGANGGVFYFDIAGSCQNVDILHNELTGCLSGESGGALYFKSAGIYDVKLQYNEINELNAGGNGGAFFFDLQENSNILDIRGNSMMNCAADTSGGALYFRSNGIDSIYISGNDMVSQEIINCAATNGSGGAFYIHSLSQAVNTVDIRYNYIQSSLSGNNSKLDGGAIYIRSVGGDVQSVKISDNTIGDNNSGISSGGNGGSLYFDFLGKCSLLNIQDNALKNCTAGGSGGAIYFKSNGIEHLSVEGSQDLYQEFRNCRATGGSGGSLYINSLSRAITGSNIAFNDIQASGNESASADGGWLFLKSGDAPVSFINLYSNTIGNETSGLSAGANGGSVYFELLGNCDALNIWYNNIKKSSASNSGGAVYFKSSALGQLKIQGTEETMQVFKNCSAGTGSGGAIFVNSTAQSIDSVEINYNSFESSQQTDNAGADGGAVCIKSAAGTMDYAGITDNVFGNAASGLGAGNNGGALSMELTGNCQGLSVLNNKFLKCRAAGSGGALYVRSAGELTNLEVSGSSDDLQLFNNCNAGDLGGSISIRAMLISSAELADNSFLNSQAQYGGAISFAANTLMDVQIRSSAFRNSKATSDGGSVHFEGYEDELPTITAFGIFSSQFDHSVSENGNGGGVFVNGNLFQFSCIQSSFTDNACNDSNEGLGAAIYINVQGNLLNFLNFGSDTVTSCESASGGFYLENIYNASFENTYFNKNSAGDFGAALVINHFNNVQFLNSVFAENNSSLSGGAIYLQDGAGPNSIANFEGCDFEFNKSLKGGALAFHNFVTASVSSSNFIQNGCYGGGTNAEYWGGAIFSELNENLEISDNIFIRNTAVDPAHPDIESFGGSLAILNTKSLTLYRNNFFNSEAKNGGAIYLKHDYVGLVSEIHQEGNEFFQNTGQYGGAIFADMMEQDILTSTQNLFFNNEAAFSGAAIDLRNLDQLVSTRDIFRSNNNKGQSPTGIIGGSALFTLGVADVSLYNSVFDENSYSNNTELDKKPTVWIKNHDNAYVENCTFLKQFPNDQPVIVKEGNDDPLIIKNTIFSGNLNPETPVTNSNALIDHSFLEGLVTADLDTLNCFDFPPPVFMLDSYILHDVDTSFIDHGDALEVYNDSIHYPIGKGTDRGDVGVSGGRYNVWDEDELEKPLLDDFTRPVIIERYNDVCGLYKIYFSLVEGDDFNDYKWYVNDSIFSTDSTNLLIKYIDDDQIVAVTGIARNTSTDAVVVGNNTINTYREITYSSVVLSFGGSDYECGDVITMEETCPLPITGINFSVRDLRMPYFGSYNYEWEFNGLSGIDSFTITDTSYSEISFDLVLAQDTIADRLFTITYTGYDDVCDIELVINCEVTLSYPNLTDNIHMLGITPSETLLDPANPMIEIAYNLPLYYCNGNTFNELAQGPVETSLGIVSIDPVAGGTVTIESIEYSGSSLLIRPSMDNFPKGDYSINVKNVCNACGFSYNENYPVNIKYVGIGEPGAENISLWPNPASGKVYLNFAGNKEQVNFEIYNSLGNSVHNGILIPGDKYEIDVADYPEGIYFVKIFNADSGEWFLKKLIVE